MDIEQQVDLIFSRKNGSGSKGHKQFWLSLGCFVVAFMLGTMLVLPVYGNKNGLDLMQEFFDSNNLDSSVVVAGDPPPEGPPPSGRFGNWAEPEIFNVTVVETDNIIQVNTNNNFTWKFFKDTFGYNEIYYNGSILVQNEQWWLEYQKNPSTWKPRGTPYNVSFEQPEPHHVVVTRKYTDYVSTDFNVTFDFYSNSRVKITLVGDIGQADTYRVRWDASGINTENIEHNHSSNRTKIWNGNDEGMVFDYEDVYSSFGNITSVDVEHQANNHKLHHYFNVGELSVGGFELDPNFGYSGGDLTTWQNIWDRQYGLIASPASSGTADNITARFFGWGAGEEVHFSLFEYDSVDGSHDLITNGETEQRTTGSSTGVWEVFSFATPPTIDSAKTYIITASSDDSVYLYRSDSGGGGTNFTDIVGGHYPSWYNPWTPTTNDADNNVDMYCSYTISGGANTAPTIAGEIPANQSTSISLTPVCNVTANDADGGDSLTVTFYENTTGSYVLRQKNTSVSPGTSVQWDNYSNAHTESTKYWWRVYVDDATDNVSETYYFTTASNATTRTPTQVFNHWFQCGNETDRNPTEVFNHWFTCGNTSYRTPTNIFNYYFVCGNTSVRSSTQVFNHWFTCGNVSVRTPTQVFNHWFQCGNETDRNPTEVFNHWFTCGNTSYRTPTNIFNYWFTCGNGSRTPVQVFDYWFTCGNRTRTATIIFNNWFNCGNVSSYESTPTDGYTFTWNETLTQLCAYISDADGDNMYYEIQQGGNVLENGSNFVYTNTTHNFTDTVNNSAHWESSKSSMSSGIALTSTTPFTSSEYQNISSVNGSGVNTSECYPPIWSHHNFSFDLSGYTIRDITGLEVRWYGYGGYRTGGVKPKWNWGTTMYFDTDGAGWYTADSTTPFATDDWSPTLEWINYTCHHDMVDWIDDNNILNVAVEHTTANNCSVIYTDYIELVVTTISGGVGNGTYCTNNISWWNDDCGVTWSWVVYVDDGHGVTSTTTYTFNNAPCVFSGVVYPATGATGICPCIDSICVVVTASYNFNMTVYGRSQHEASYVIWDKYINFTADEYCFCLCGYIVDGWHQPMRYNTTYYWYVNASKYDNVSLYNQTSVFSFMTASGRSACVSSGGGGGGMGTNSVMGVIGLIGIFGLLGFIMNRRRRKNNNN